MRPVLDKALGGLIVGLVAFAILGGLYEAVRGEGEVNRAGLLPKGAPAPPFLAIRHADKKPIQSSELAGKVVVLDFWGTWCGPCRREARVIRDLAKQYAGKDVVVLALDDEQGEPDPVKLVTDFLKEESLEDYPVAYPDPAALQRFQVSRFPTLYILGRDGTVRFDGSGMVSASRLRAEIDAALGG